MRRSGKSPSNPRRGALLRAILAAATGLGSGPLILAGELPVPNIQDVTRVDRMTLPSPQDMLTATFILKTVPHPTGGDAYVIVTDQTDPGFLAPLGRLAEFHHGSIIKVSNLGALRTDAAERDQLISALRRTQPRFLAVAPKLSSFTTPMLLGLWRVLTTLSDDQRLSVFPGMLVAPNQAAFASLIDRSISYHPQAVAQLRPFVIGQVIGPLPYGKRSLQKVRMMRNLFADYGCTTSSLVTLEHSAVAMNVTIAPVKDEWQAAVTEAGHPIPAIPAAVRPTLDRSSLLLLFGHGNPGTACSLDVAAFRDVPMTDKTVMCGDCFSAAPQESGISGATRSAGAQRTEKNEDSLAMRSVANGAVVVYAHMRENAGFPHLFPVLEAWMDGLTVGEAYQRQMNALLAFAGLSSDDLASMTVAEANSLLYVIIGDPALQPLAKMTGTSLKPIASNP